MTLIDNENVDRFNPETTLTQMVVVTEDWNGTERYNPDRPLEANLFVNEGVLCLKFYNHNKELKAVLDFSDRDNRKFTLKDFSIENLKSFWKVKLRVRDWFDSRLDFVRPPGELTIDHLRLHVGLENFYNDPYQVTTNRDLDGFDGLTVVKISSHKDRTGNSWVRLFVENGDEFLIKAFRSSGVIGGHSEVVEDEALDLENVIGVYERALFDFEALYTKLLGEAADAGLDVSSGGLDELKDRVMSELLSEEEFSE